MKHMNVNQVRFAAGLVKGTIEWLVLAVTLITVTVLPGFLVGWYFAPEYAALFGIVSHVLIGQKLLYPGYPFTTPPFI